MRSCTEPGGCIFICIQLVRWIPVLVLFAALTWGYYAYVLELCIYTIESNLQRVFYLFFFHLLLILFCISYFRTIFCELQLPPSVFYPNEECLSELATYQDDEGKRQSVLQRYVIINKIPVKTRDFSRGIRYCQKCKCIKPDRSHHCSLCGQCVLKFDHHCPWVNNCVNYHNYKFFLLFLGYGLTFCLFVFFTDLPYFVSFWTKDFQDRNLKVGKFHLLFLVFVSGMFAISLSCLFLYHLYLTAKNRSTVESFRAPILESGPDKNAFNSGIAANYREVFGRDWTLWFLPVFSSCGDGSVFPIHHPGLCLLESAPSNSQYAISNSVSVLEMV